MKIAMLNTFDGGGGAARSAWRLHQGLLRKGVASSFVTQYNKSGDPSIVCGTSRFEKLVALLRPLVDMLPLKLYFKRDHGQPFSSAFVPVAKRVRQSVEKADVVHLHWIVHGFVNIPFLRSVRRPIIWTLHDSWAFTGGCHLPAACRRYKENCGNCPQLSSRCALDLTRFNWKLKMAAWKDVNMAIVTPSNWLAECARSSSLFAGRRIEVIPNGIDTNIFKPLDRSECRRILNLPQDKHLILFGAMGATSDKNKGFDLLQDALDVLPRQIGGKECMLVVFGARPLDLPDLPVEARFMGTFSDDVALSVLYSSADVMVAPSRQENLPNTIMEAMACGTPAVAFDTGGIPDLIDHQYSGYLAKPFNTVDLAHGIRWVLRQTGLGLKSRAKVQKDFDLNVVTQRYIELYSEIMAEKNGH